jgi:hypothetical protein
LDNAVLQCSPHSHRQALLVCRWTVRPLRWWRICNIRGSICNEVQKIQKEKLKIEGKFGNL